MGLNFGSSLFPRGDYIEGESGNFVNVDENGNLKVSGDINILNTTIDVTQSGDWNISGDMTIQNSVLDVTQSGDWNVSGDMNITNALLAVSGDITVQGTADIHITDAFVPVTQSGNWNISGDVTILNSNIGVTQSGNWNISGDVHITDSFVPVTQSGNWNISGDIVVLNSELNMGISGTTVINAGLNTVQRGSNIAFGLAVDTYTLNQTQIGNISDFLNAYTSDYLEWIYSVEAGPVSTVLILDLGSIQTVHSLIVGFSTNQTAANDVGGAWSTVISHSENKSSWIDIFNETHNDAMGETYEEAFIEDDDVRYLRISFTTLNDDASVTRALRLRSVIGSY